MPFNFKLIAALLAISWVSLSEAADSAIASNLTLYAYGGNITGLTIFYSDGMNDGSAYFFQSLCHSIIMS